MEKIASLLNVKWEDATHFISPHWIKENDTISIQIEQVDINYRIWIFDEDDNLPEVFKSYCPKWRGGFYGLLFFESFDHAKQFVDRFLERADKLMAFL